MRLGGLGAWRLKGANGMEGSEVGVVVRLIDGLGHVVENRFIGGFG